MNLKNNTFALPYLPPARIGRRNAYHQAGQAVAVYLGNKQKNLPALHFQIAVRPLPDQTGLSGRFSRIPGKYGAELEGGRLIPYLPYSFQVTTQQLSPAEKQQCQSAFEADVVNILAGSLAEAKYVALRDGEVFNANLVYLGALKFYGGGHDMKVIDDYMACLLPGDISGQNKKLGELFLTAYGFINDGSNWQAIKALAETLYNQPKEVLCCEELMKIMDNPASAFTIAPIQPSLAFSVDSAAH